MNTKPPTSQHFQWLLDSFVIWAQLRSDIQAALVVGSRARSDYPADEYSDLDLVLITTQPETYLTQADWLHELGTVWLTFVEPTGTGEGMERRALFEPGLDVDFAIVPATAVPHLMQSDQATAVLRRGVRVLLDKHNLIPQAQWATLTTPLTRPPSPAEFQEALHDFWYHAVWTAKKLRRGELWTAKDCCDDYLKRLMLKLIEWHSCAKHGPDYDTWHNGRFLERWADPRAVAELQVAFAHYETDDIWRGLTWTMNLFRWLAQEAASLMCLPYPAVADERASALVALLQKE